MENVSGNTNPPSLADLEFLKYMHMANCSEKAGLGRCCCCDNDANNKSEFNPDMVKEKKMCKEMYKDNN